MTLLLYPLQELDPGVSSGVLYVLGVLLVSVCWGLRLGLLTSVASAAALFYFHTSPAGLHAKSAGDSVAIGTLLVTASVASVIADAARRREESDARSGTRRLRASRARVLSAADAERRRVVRDLHDGAQQRLVHTVVTLKLAARAIAGEDREARRLRATRRSITPSRPRSSCASWRTASCPRCSRGAACAPGSRRWRRACPCRSRSRVPRDRLPRAVESTAYFVVAEALTNVVKHSHAQRAEIEAARRERRATRPGARRRRRRRPAQRRRPARARGPARDPDGG